MRRHRHSSIGFLLLGAFLLAGTLGCGVKKEAVIEGRTMGTTYQVKVVTGIFDNLDELEKQIAGRLEAINNSMSTYRPDSEISRFNAMTAVGKPFPISADFYAVLTQARHIHALTQGAWDGTIKPILNLWGFGNTTNPSRVPRAEEIAGVMQTVGFQRIRMGADRTIAKTHPEVTLDLASIAKGYAVDAVSGILISAGYRDFLVEIGGEVYGSGARKDGRLWRVGINQPDPDVPLNQVYRAISIDHQALATSGDYRNFFMAGNRRYSHIIDPRTGYPVDSEVVSVSVLARTCTLADGLATGLMVMGAEEGISMARRLKHVDVFIIRRLPDGTFGHVHTTGFPVTPVPAGSRP